MLEDLKTYFANKTLPKGKFRLNSCVVLINVNLFVKSSIMTLERNKGNMTYMPYYDRLVELKNKLEK